jgi:hypothetical protein
MVAVFAVGVLGSACTAGSGGASSAPAATPLRPIASCSSGEHVPAAVVKTVPSAAVPPTTVLRVGGAVELATPSHTTVGFAGPANSAEQAVLCRAKAAHADAGQTRLLARRPGYVRVGTQTAGLDSQKLALIKVTS